MKSAPQLNTFSNAEPMRVPIVEAYPDKLQPANPSNNQYIFKQTRSKNLIVTPKIRKRSKMRFEKIKADTPEQQPHVISEM